MARLYRQRPSTLLGIPDPYVAYCVDEAAAWLLSQKESQPMGTRLGKGVQAKRYSIPHSICESWKSTAAQR